MHAILGLLAPIPGLMIGVFLWDVIKHRWRKRRRDRAFREALVALHERTQQEEDARGRR
jgi:hypothetical protein